MYGSEPSIAHLQPVVDEVGERQRHGEQAGFDVLHREPVCTDDRDDFDRVRPERPDDGVVAVLVGAQDAVRVVVCAGHQALQVGRVGRQVCPGELISSAHIRSPPAQQRDSGFLRDEGHVDDVGDRLPRIDADVICLPPLVFRAGYLVPHPKTLVGLHTQCVHV